MANCLLIRASLVPLNTMNGGSLSPLRVTPKSTVQQTEVPEVFIPMVLAPHFSNVNKPAIHAKIDVFLININHEPRFHTKDLNLLIGICYKLKHSGLLGQVLCSEQHVSLACRRTIPSFTIYRLTLFDRTGRENISFPSTRLSSIVSIRMVQHRSCCLKPSKVDRNISNSPTLFPTPPW